MRAFVFSVSLLAGGLPYLDRQLELALPEPRCIHWSLPMLEADGVRREELLYCCFASSSDVRRVCVRLNPKI